MDKKIDYLDYWKEVQTLQKETKNVDYLEESRYLQEGELEADWLREVGFGHLSDAYQQGREVTDEELDASLTLLPKHQAETVKKRVRTLNQTIRNKYRQQKTRHRKPDIRDVFRDIETSSTGTRSRSATPDSLDSTEGANETDEECASPVSPLSRSPTSAQQTVTDWGEPSSQKSVLRRTPSVPIAKVNLRPGHDIFRRSGHWSGLHRVDIASNTEGIELLGYQRFGTLYGPKINKDRTRSGSDPINLLSAVNVVDLKTPAENLLRRDSFKQNSLSYSHDDLWQPSTRAEGALSFEQCFRESDVVQPVLNQDNSNLVQIEDVSDSEFVRLKPLIWLELSSLFDQHSIPFHKRKLNKRKRKENGNVFGVSLSSLVMRDQRICPNSGTVPRIFQLVLDELESRCCKEEGILRLAGQKQKVESLCDEVEQCLYTRPDMVEQAVRRATCHELTAVLKRLLQKLPQPLLTSELIDLFYRSHELPTAESLRVAINLLVLLLPLEHRSTLRALLQFLLAVVSNQTSNKMSLHNVAMIMAPSIFLPACVHQLDKADLDSHVRMAAVSCRLTESLLQYGLQLWNVPSHLLLQAQQALRQLAHKKMDSSPTKHKSRKKCTFEEPITSCSIASSEVCSNL